MRGACVCVCVCVCVCWSCVSAPVVAAVHFVSLCISRISIAPVACGERHSLALTSLGTVYAWGDAGHGCLGLGSKSKYAPTHIPH